ncbi:MAG: alpha-L-fucosidase [Bacteroidales bacterium]|nr:alpha-L-fucosidase [Candidatus Cacconaster merdequi]
MRRIILTLAAALCCIASPASDWHGDKYSMFIHFGVYSSLGGVWKGKPVTFGYSEQIQACGGIYADQYADVAEAFNPVNFNADEIVALAKAAGMRSIVITSKHHDGFCMWNTATTDYDSVDMSASGRDFIKELSEACERGGVNMGLYFSLIDWHLPYGYPMTTHNSDYILPQHHKYNMDQVRELCSNYGKISELWFDMGSLTPQQSREIYELVHSLQPECMVGGRLGNDMYDFSVMGDNSYPDGTLQIAWQSPASMFNETWGYRSWQKRCPVEEKVAEKLRNLVNVVSQGGNFLLNIGPDDKGGIVPYEKEVLTRMGSWLKENGDAIYGTECSPFRSKFDWGVVTRKGKMLYLILSGKCPENGIISVPDPDNEGKVLNFNVSPSDYADACDIKVIRHECVSTVEPQTPAPLPATTRQLRPENAEKDYSYTCQDYYTNIRSTIAYNWFLKGRIPKQLTLLYTQSEMGRKVALSVDGETSSFSLAGNAEASRTVAMAPADTTVTRAHVLRSYSISRVVNAPEDGDYLFEVGAGNYLKVFVNRERVISKLNAYRVPYTKEYALLHLQKGENTIKVECFNRHEKSVRITLSSSEAPLYKMTVPVQAGSGSHRIRLEAEDRSSIHQDCKLHNVRIELK